MGKRLKIKAEAIPEAERIIAEYPRKELRVTEWNVTRDMSVSIVDQKNYVFPFNEIIKGKFLPLSNNLILDFKVVDVTDDHLTLEWDRTTEVYEVKLGEKVKTNSGSAGTRYFTGSVRYEIEFKYVTLENKMFEILAKISDRHAKLGSRSQYPETTRDEIIALRLLDEVIKEGNIGLYVLKALLMASNDWTTGMFVRPSLFRLILHEGIEKGCLKPEVADGWNWLQTAADNNDPKYFMDDRNLWHDILAEAAEAGNEIARSIMNRISEPKQIIDDQPTQ